jgi:hypothetical protein
MKRIISMILASMILLVVVIPASAADKPVLTDIKGHWAESYINSLVDIGVVSGYKDETFRPESNITRAEFIAMLINTAGAKTDPYRVTSDSVKYLKIKPNFSDVSDTSWYYKHLLIAVNKGVVPNGNGAKFNGDELIKRDEMAFYSTKLLKISGISTIPFKDIDSNQYKDYINVAYSWKIINGKSNTTYDPNGLATRAEAATIVKRANNTFIPMFSNWTYLKMAKSMMDGAQVYVDTDNEQQKTTFDNSLQAISGLLDFAEGGGKVDMEAIPALYDIAEGTGKNLANVYISINSHKEAKKFMDSADEYLKRASEDRNRAKHAND